MLSFDTCEVSASRTFRSAMNFIEGIYGGHETAPLDSALGGFWSDAILKRHS